MKRDMNLIRSLLLQLEGENVDISEFTDGQILYHKAMIEEAGLAHGAVMLGSSGYPAAVDLTYLTWEGHEFICASRDNTIWEKAMIATKKISGSVTLSVLQSLLESMLKTKLEI